MKVLLIIVLTSLGFNSYAQLSTRFKQYSELNSTEKEIVDSLIYTRIPFNALKAKQDLKNDTIRILRLSPKGTLIGTAVSTNEEVLRIENRFGFIYDCKFFALPEEHLKLKEEEYNAVVYQYLDSIFCFDTEKEIYSEMNRMLWERTTVSNRTDKELRKFINVSLKNENKDVKKQVFIVDKMYRDKNYNEAINKYIEISNQNINKQTMEYILNSIYYCYLNMLQIEKADNFRQHRLQHIKLVKK